MGSPGLAWTSATESPNSGLTQITCQCRARSLGRSGWPSGISIHPPLSEYHQTDRAVQRPGLPLLFLRSRVPRTHSFWSVVQIVLGDQPAPSK